MPQKITPQQRNEIRKKIYALQAQGLTLDEVGAKLGIGNPGSHRQAVKHYLKDTAGRCRCCRQKLKTKNL